MVLKLPEYIDNKEFEAQILKCTRRNATKSDLTKLVQMLYLLADNITRAFPFRMVDKEDAMQEAVMVCLIKRKKFKPESGKAFNYFTTIMLNHFKQLYRSAKNYHLLKERFLERQRMLIGGNNIEGTNEAWNSGESERD